MKNWVKKVTSIFKNALVGGVTPEVLTRSFCIGMYIAISPFPGAHTVMVFALSYFLKLHFPTVLITSFVNNPWTMIPIYSGDYFFGHWLVHDFLGLNPISFTIPFTQYLGINKLCPCSFVIGGNILAVVATIASYPFAKKTFRSLALKHSSTEVQ